PSTVGTRRTTTADPGKRRWERTRDRTVQWRRPSADRRRRCRRVDRGRIRSVWRVASMEDDKQRRAERDAAAAEENHGGAETQDTTPAADAKAKPAKAKRSSARRGR